MIKTILSYKSLRLALVSGLLGLVSLSLPSYADDAKKVDPKVVKQISEKLEQARPDLQLESVAASPIGGLYQAQIINGPRIYITENGRYFVAGDLFEVAADRLVNVSEQARNGDRVAALAKVDQEDMIIFSPKGETKASITVFTDIDCGYCRKLHAEVPELNKMGIEVRYLAYPRAGANSQSADKLVTAWCGKNSRELLTKFKAGENVPIKVCEDNPVAEQFALGRSLGVTATPALVLENGELQLGYMQAPQLAARLGVTP